MTEDDPLFRELRGNLFHSTSIEAYSGIIESKSIKPNNGNFPYSHGRSPYSCCSKINAISLLDFGLGKRPLFSDCTLPNWTSFLYNHHPVTVLLEIERDSLSKDLLDYDCLKDVHEGKLAIVAEAEVCYSSDISTSSISRCIFVSYMNPNSFRIIDKGIVSPAELSEIVELLSKSACTKNIRYNPFEDI